MSQMRVFRRKNKIIIITLGEMSRAKMKGSMRNLANVGVRFNGLKWLGHGL